MMNDENWTLPVHVSWPDQNDVAAVWFCELPMLKIQLFALSAKLDSLGPCRDGKWWVLRGVLESCAVQIIGDPETEIIWRPLEARVKFRTSENIARAEFFADYARTGIINDPIKAEIVFVSFCKHMLSWMLNHQRPVSLGFCDLYAVPYRPNWKQMLYQVQHGRRTATVRKKWSVKELARTTTKSLTARGTPDDVMDPKFLFWCKKDSHMYWSIEARPRNMWWRMVKAVEMAKKSKRKGEKYFAGIGDTLKRLLPQTLELYVAYLQQVTVPFVRLAPSVRKIGSKLSKAISPRLFEKTSLPSHGPAAYGRRGRVDPGTVLDHVSSAAFVSTLSPVQREKLAMRDTREDLARPVATESAGSPSP